MKIVPFNEFMSRTSGGRPNQMDMSSYEGHPFDCACGNTHVFNASKVEVLRELKGMKLVLGCPETGAITCVKLKGIIKFKGFESLFGAISEQ